MTWHYRIHDRAVTLDSWYGEFLFVLVECLAIERERGYLWCVIPAMSVESLGIALRDSYLLLQRKSG